MSAKEKYNPIDYQLSVAKNMISDLQSFIQKYQGKAYMLGDSVYFEKREQMSCYICFCPRTLLYAHTYYP